MPDEENKLNCFRNHSYEKTKEKRKNPQYENEKKGTTTLRLDLLYYRQHP